MNGEFQTEENSRNATVASAIIHNDVGSTTFRCDHGFTHGGAPVPLSVTVAVQVNGS